MKSPKIAPPSAASGTLDASLSQELSLIRDGLNLDMEQRIQSLHHELLLELEELVKKNDFVAPPHQNPGSLGSLIHTITDSKLHQMNLELRQHMTAKLDVLLQDMKDEQQAFQKQIQQELDLHHKRGTPPTQNGLDRLINGKFPPSHASAWINLPALIAGTILLALLISWPS